MATLDLREWEQRGSRGNWYRVSDLRSKTPYVLRSCECCGAEALVQARSAASGKGRFCSMVCAKTKDVITYKQAHTRAVRAKGKAAEHTCVDCGGSAQEWSYMGGDNAELVSPEGKPYSTSPDFYTPRCIPCHKVFDGDFKLSPAQRRGIRASVGASSLQLAALHHVSRSLIDRIRRVI